MQKAAGRKYGMLLSCPTSRIILPTGRPRVTRTSYYERERLIHRTYVRRSLRRSTVGHNANCGRSVVINQITCSFFLTENFTTENERERGNSATARKSFAANERRKRDERRRADAALFLRSARAAFVGSGFTRHLVHLFPHGGRNSSTHTRPPHANWRELALKSGAVKHTHERRHDVDSANHCTTTNS